MNFIKYFGSLLVLLFAFHSLLAQPPSNDPLAGQDSLVLENERIEDVIDSEKPFIKPPYQDLQKGEQDNTDYRSKDFYVETDFEPGPPDINPLTQERPPKLKNGYVRLGIGRFLTPVGQLYVNNGRDKNADLGLKFTHISAHDDKLPLREFRQDYGTFSISKVDKDYTLGGKLHLYNTAYWTEYDKPELVGFEENFRDSLRMGFTRFAADVNLKTNSTSRSESLFDVGTGVKVYGDRRDNSEFHFNLRPNAGYQLTDEFQAMLESELVLIRGMINDTSQNRFFVDALPQIRFNNGRHSVRAGVRLNFFRNSIDSVGNSFLGPVVDARIGIVPNKLTAVAGFTSGMYMNNYYDLIFENPYLQRGSEMRASTEKMNIYAGVEGNIGDQFDYAARVYYRQVEDQLVYIPGADDFYFVAVYDSLLRNTGVHLEANYDLNEAIRAGASLNFNVYNTTTLPEFFNASPLRLDFYGSYTWDEKLRAMAELNFYGRSPQFEDAVGQVFDRKAFLGINIAADYRIVDRFSVFASVNNILGGNFQRWYQYPERGIDFRAGITVSF
jgi:hypothetical protein